jgi:endonuclease III
MTSPPKTAAKTTSEKPNARKPPSGKRAPRASAAGAAKSPQKPGQGSPKPARASARKAAPKTSVAQAPQAVDAPPVQQASVLACYEALVRAHPDAHCELDHKSPFQLIVATALSAQSTDVQVNKVTPGLFKAYPTPQALGSASQEQVEALINRLGMFRQKAKNLIGMAQALVRDHGGQVPPDLAALVKLPGVGRKTANVVLGVAFAAPVGVVVDTHVQRITQRLHWTRHQDPIKIEQDLMRLLPQSEWDRVSHTLIFHGRRVCFARRPACSTCPVNERCASAFVAETVGRKPARVR